VWLHLTEDCLHYHREAYSSGILAYHVYCDKRGIPGHLRAPISHPLATSFIASLAGSYFSLTISNYIHKVRAWHVLHGLPWKLNTLEIDALMRGAERLTPASSKRKKNRCPTSLTSWQPSNANCALTNPLMLQCGPASLFAFMQQLRSVS
jgi:hypothetical protein